MHRRATGFGMLVALLILGPAGRSGAEWDWYAGNIGFYSARNASATLSEKVQQGVDTGLDWLVLSGHFREGIYVGLRDVIREEDLNAPRMEGGEDRRGDDTAFGCSLGHSPVPGTEPLDRGM